MSVVANISFVNNYNSLFMLKATVVNTSTLTADEVSTNTLIANNAVINTLAAGDITTSNINNADTINTYFINSQYATVAQVLNVTGTASIPELGGSNATFTSVSMKKGYISSIVTNNINLDGNLLDTAGAGIGAVLLLNGYPIATTSTSISTVANWSIFPAISTIYLNSNNIVQGGDIQTHTLNADNTYTYDLQATNQIVFGTNLYGGNAYLSNVSAIKVQANLVSTLNLETNSAKIQTLVNSNVTTDTINATNITAANYQTTALGSYNGTTGNFGTVNTGTLNVSGAATFTSGTRPDFQKGINVSGANNFNNGSLDNVPNINTQGSQSMNINSANGLGLNAPTQIKLTCDATSNIAGYGAVTLLGKNGNRGQINLQADPGYINLGVQIQGEVNITANGGGGVTAYATGGVVNITANTGSSPVLGTASYSAIKLNAAGITSYAGFASPFFATPGYNLIQGSLGVEIIAGSIPSIFPSVPGTIYLYGATGIAQQTGGVRITNGIGVDFIVPYPQGFNTQPYDLIISGNPAGQKVTLSNVRILQSDNGTLSGFETINASNITGKNFIVQQTTGGNGVILGLSGQETLTNFSNVSTLGIQTGLIYADNISSLNASIRSLNNISTIDGYTIDQLVSSVTPPQFYSTVSTFTQLFTSSFQAVNVSSITANILQLNGVSTLDGYTIAQLVSSTTPVVFFSTVSSFQQLATSSFSVSSIIGTGSNLNFQVGGLQLNGVPLSQALQLSTTQQLFTSSLTANNISSGVLQVSSINGYNLSQLANQPLVSSFSLLSASTFGTQEFFASTGTINVASNVVLNVSSINGYNTNDFIAVPNISTVSSFNNLYTNNLSAGQVVAQTLSSQVLNASSINGYTVAQFLAVPLISTVSTFSQVFTSSIQTVNVSSITANIFALNGVSSIDGFSIAQLVSSVSPPIPAPSSFTQLYTSSLVANGIRGSNYDLNVTSQSIVTVSAGNRLNLNADTCNIAITAPNVQMLTSFDQTVGVGHDYTLTATNNISMNSSNTAILYTTNTAPIPPSQGIVVLGQGNSIFGSQLNTTVSAIGTLNLNGADVRVNGNSITGLVKVSTFDTLFTSTLNVSTIKGDNGTDVTIQSIALIPNVVIIPFAGAGSQLWTTPAGVTQVYAELYGGGGGGGFANNGGSATDQHVGGAGGYAAGFVAVTPGQDLLAFIAGGGGGGTYGSGGGAGGYNGGGAGASGHDTGDPTLIGGGGGGGYTYLQYASPATTIAFAGGGGGSISIGTNPVDSFIGGAGGGLNGQDGQYNWVGAPSANIITGKGAVTNTPGAGGQYGTTNVANASSGNNGGSGGTNAYCGGGGGGYAGGGGGAPGGAGSSYIGGFTSGATTVQGGASNGGASGGAGSSPGGAGGNGFIRLTYYTAGGSGGNINLVAQNTINLSSTQVYINTRSTIMKGDLNVSTINGLPPASNTILPSGLVSTPYLQTQLVSTVIGLGSAGYISTATSLPSGLVSTPYLQTQLTSTVAGLGSAGYISTATSLPSGLVSTPYLQTQLASTVVGLGSAGYISTATSLPSGLVSTPYLQTQLASTVAGLGSAGYISTIASTFSQVYTSSLQVNGITSPNFNLTSPHIELDRTGGGSLILDTNIDLNCATGRFLTIGNFGGSYFQIQSGGAQVLTTPTGQDITLTAGGNLVLATSNQTYFNNGGFVQFNVDHIYMYRGYLDMNNHPIYMGNATIYNAGELYNNNTDLLLTGIGRNIILQAATNTIILTASTINVNDVNFVRSGSGWGGGVQHTIYGDVLNGGKYIKWSYDNNPGTQIADNNSVELIAPLIQFNGSVNQLGQLNMYNHNIINIASLYFQNGADIYAGYSNQLNFDASNSYFLGNLRFYGSGRTLDIAGNTITNVQQITFPGGNITTGSNYFDIRGNGAGNYLSLINGGSYYTIDTAGNCITYSSNVTGVRANNNVYIQSDTSYIELVASGGTGVIYHTAGFTEFRGNAGFTQSNSYIGGLGHIYGNTAAPGGGLAIDYMYGMFFNSAGNNANFYASIGNLIMRNYNGGTYIENYNSNGTGNLSLYCASNEVIVGTGNGHNIAINSGSNIYLNAAGSDGLIALYASTINTQTLQDTNITGNRAVTVAAGTGDISLRTSSGNFNASGAGTGHYASFNNGSSYLQFDNNLNITLNGSSNIIITNGGSGRYTNFTGGDVYFSGGIVRIPGSATLIDIWNNCFISQSGGNMSLNTNSNLNLNGSNITISGSNAVSIVAPNIALSNVSSINGAPYTGGGGGGWVGTATSDLNMCNYAIKNTSNISGDTLTISTTTTNIKSSYITTIVSPTFNTSGGYVNMTATGNIVLDTPNVIATGDVAEKTLTLVNDSLDIKGQLSLDSDAQLNYASKLSGYGFGTSAPIPLIQCGTARLTLEENNTLIGGAYTIPIAYDDTSYCLQLTYNTTPPYASDAGIVWSGQGNASNGFQISAIGSNVGTGITLDWYWTTIGKYPKGSAE